VFSFYLPFRAIALGEQRREPACGEEASVCADELPREKETSMTSTHCESQSLPVLGLILAMMLWGSSFIAMKIALSSFDPLLVIFGRMLTATLVFLPFKKRLQEIRYQRGDWRYIAFMALCEPCLYFSFEAYALKYTSASQAGMVTALLPLTTAIAARRILNESLSLWRLAGLFAALLGVLGLSLSGQPTESSPNPLLGNTLELLAMVCATGYTISSRFLSVRYSPLSITALQSFIGTIFFLPILFFPSTRFPAQLPFAGLLSIVYLGGIISVVAYFLYNYGLSRIPASQVTSYVNLIPVFAVLFGWLILDEHLTAFQYVAAATVMGGIFASRQEGSQLRGTGGRFLKIFALGNTK
jgi:drug/metabolite transporter (DMT)-like permease